MRYYIGKNGRQLGPFVAQQVREQLASGAISPEDLCWREGLIDWIPVRSEFSTVAPPPIPIAASAALPAASLPLADRGRRLLAHLVDVGFALLAFTPGAIWAFAAIAFAGSSNGLSYLESTDRENGVDLDAANTAVMNVGFALLLTALLVVVLCIVQLILLSTRGQTIGKKVLGIRIVRLDGSDAGFVHAVLLRVVVMRILNAFTGITWLIDPLLIFREDRRCLHDMIADTTVIDA